VSLSGFFFALDKSLEYLEKVFFQNQKIINWCVVLILIGNSISSYHAQSSKLILIDDKKEKITIPFELINGLIVIKATLGAGQNVHLLLDTGAENLILFNREIREQLHLPEGKPIVIKGADLVQQVSGQICRNVSITLPNNKPILRDFIILDDNFMNFNETIGIPIDGLIGGRLFWGSVLDINYKKSEITFYKRDAFNPPIGKGYEKISLSMEDNKPYIHADLYMYKGNKTNVKLLLDTGSSLGSLLFLETHTNFELPEKYVEGPLGVGLGGDIIGYQAKFKSLYLSNSLFFHNVVSSYQVLNEEIDTDLINNRNGILGNPILSRFRIIIDYIKSELYLKPIKNYNKNLYYDKSGLIIYAVGEKLNQFVIKYVIKGAPAHDAGLQSGDKIHRIGIVPTKLLTLSAVNRKLNKKDGKKVKMTIIRDGEKLKKSILLDDYLSVRS